MDVNGSLYGTTNYGGGGGGPACYSVGCGTVFSIATSGMEKVLHGFSGPDGEYPDNPLLYVTGTLYGSAYGGGSSGYGTIFALKP
ncbi:MAG TPA: choice-of-anchor tandem repeat GloVer-containing protein [Candidatus Cybelea sp.]